VRELGQRLLRHGSVDLHGQLRFAGPLERVERALQRSFHAAEVVVGLLGATVDADAQGGHAVIGEGVHHLAAEQRSGRRRDAHRHVERARVVDELEEIRPLDRIAAGHDQHAAELLDAADQGLALLRVELVRVATGDGVGAAVLAGEVASDGHLPVDVAGSVGVDEGTVWQREELLGEGLGHQGDP
jgi:hypothetical protein